MELFSERNDIPKMKTPIKIESRDNASTDLRNAMLTFFEKYYPRDEGEKKFKLEAVNKIFQKFPLTDDKGFLYSEIDDHDDGGFFAEGYPYPFRSMVMNCPWDTFYDITECIANELNNYTFDNYQKFEKSLNAFFNHHGIGYKITDGKIESRD